MHVPLVVLTPNLTRVITGLYSFHLLNGIWNSAAPGFNEEPPDITEDFHGLVDAHRFEDQGQQWVIIGHYELLGDSMSIGPRKVLIAPFWTQNAALLAMRQINTAVEVMFTGEAPKGAKVDLRGLINTEKPETQLDKDTRVVNIDPPSPASS